MKRSGSAGTYFPPGMFPRGGLRVGDLAERQRAAAMRVLAAALSPQGYEKVLQIVESDEVLRPSRAAPAGSIHAVRARATSRI